MAKDFLQKPFLFLSGDVITNSKQLSLVATTFLDEYKNGVIGTISGATDHSPAPTHALLTMKDGFITQLLFPPTETWGPHQLREIGVAFFDQRFIEVLEASDDRLYISQILGEHIQQGAEVAGKPYFDKWYHFVKPNDLQTTIIFNRKF